MKLKTELNFLTDEINQHPLLEIFEQTVNPKPDPLIFESFKKIYNFNVPPFIQNMYLEMNGFTLVYGLKNNSADELELFNAQSKDYLLEKGPPYILGSIKFLSFEKVFLEDTWNSVLYNTKSDSDELKFTFKNITYTYNSFGKQLKPFDLFSDETCAAFLLIPDLMFDVILLTDNYIDWNNSRIISIEDYCKLMFSTKGIIDAREKYLSSINGDRQKKLIINNTERLTPKIFRSIKK